MIDLARALLAAMFTHQGRAKSPGREPRRPRSGSRPRSSSKSREKKERRSRSRSRRRERHRDDDGSDPEHGGGGGSGEWDADGEDGGEPADCNTALAQYDLVGMVAAGSGCSRGRSNVRHLSQSAMKSVALHAVFFPSLLAGFCGDNAPFR